MLERFLRASTPVLGYCSAHSGPWRHPRAPPGPSMLVKKYTNRRLYDTEESRYITLEELAEKVRAGQDATVVDAKTGEDLTRVTLTQIIMESRGAARILPVPLLFQLIRLGDESLAEFLGIYLGQALDGYLTLKRGAQAIAPIN